jgi:hypothetical protein
MPYEYVNLERMYFAPNEPKDEGDVRRERTVILLVIALAAGLAVGLPLLVNLGKALFEIPPVIY